MSRELQNSIVRMQGNTIASSLPGFIVKISKRSSFTISLFILFSLVESVPVRGTARHDHWSRGSGLGGGGEGGGGVDS
jgi:hypothetical protein